MNPTIEYSQHNPWCERCGGSGEQPAEQWSPSVVRPCDCPTAVLTLTGTEPVDVVQKAINDLLDWGPTLSGHARLLIRFTGEGDNLRKVLEADCGWCGGSRMALHINGPCTECVDPDCPNCKGDGLLPRYDDDEELSYYDACDCGRAIDTSGIDGVVLADLSQDGHDSDCAVVGGPDTEPCDYCNLAALREWAEREGKGVYK